MTPSVDIDASETIRYFTQAVDRANDLRPLFDTVADNFHERQRQVFTSRGGSQGTPWAPLKPKYLAWRQRTGRGTSLLRFTNARGGMLYASLTQRNGPQQVRQVRSDELRVGTRAGIAEAHQKGRGSLPARPLVNITEATRKHWSDLLVSHLLED